jgi:hypothetical protein
MSMPGSSTNDLHIHNFHVDMPNFLSFYHNQYMVVVDRQQAQPVEAIHKHDHPNEDNHIWARRQMAESTRFKISITFAHYSICTYTSSIIFVHWLGRCGLA